MKENKKEITSPKPKNTTGAKIVLIFLVIFAILLSLYKFTLYLGEPKVSFYNTVDSLTKDFSNTLEEFKNIKLLNLITENNAEISTNITLEASNLVGDLQGLDTRLNSMNYVGNVRINKKDNYLSAKLKMNKDSIERMNIDYLNTESRDYIKSVGASTEYIDITEYPINFFALDYKENAQLSEIVKTEILKFLETQRFYHEFESIAVNNKTVDCEKTYYTIASSDLNNILNKIENDKTITKYLSNLLRTDEKNLSNRINEIKEYLEIDNNSTFIISTFISDNTKEGVKFEISHIKNNNEISKISYIKDFSYHKIETVKNGITNSITLSGTLKNRYILTIQKDEETIILSASDKEDNREGIVRIIKNDTRDTKLNANFTYNLVADTGLASTLTSSIKVEFYDNEKTGNMLITLNGAINNNVEIEPLEVNNSITKDQFENDSKTIKAIIIDYIKEMNLDAPITSDLPLSFTE